MEEDPKLSESLEDYLEVILDLEETHKVARAKDIAEKLGIQRGSVTGALKESGRKKPHQLFSLQFYHPHRQGYPDCQNDHPASPCAEGLSDKGAAAG